MSALELRDFLHMEIESLSEDILKEIYFFTKFMKEQNVKNEDVEFNRLSENTLEKIWNNEEDTIYDKYL